jgi:hypothetical protein
MNVLVEDNLEMGLNKTEYHKYCKSTYQCYIKFEAITANIFTAWLLHYQAYQWYTQNQSFRDLLPCCQGQPQYWGHIMSMKHWFLAHQ